LDHLASAGSCCCCCCCCWCSCWWCCWRRRVLRDAVLPVALSSRARLCVCPPPQTRNMCELHMLPERRLLIGGHCSLKGLLTRNLHELVFLLHDTRAALRGSVLTPFLTRSLYEFVFSIESSTASTPKNSRCS